MSVLGDSNRAIVPATVV